jgi:hypothetical protein
MEAQMNSLSIMLYAADVVGNMQGLLTATAIIGGTVYAAATMVYAGVNMDRTVNPKFHGIVWPMWLLVFCAITAAVLPSRETVLLIAGSEAGEAVVTSDAGKRIISQIEAAISAQLSEMAGAK